MVATDPTTAPAGRLLIGNPTVMGAADTARGPRRTLMRPDAVVIDVASSV